MVTVFVQVGIHFYSYYIKSVVTSYTIYMYRWLYIDIRHSIHLCLSMSNFRGMGYRFDNRRVLDYKAKISPFCRWYQSFSQTSRDNNKAEPFGPLLLQLQFDLAVDASFCRRNLRQGLLPVAIRRNNNFPLYCSRRKSNAVGKCRLFVAVFDMYNALANLQTLLNEICTAVSCRCQQSIRK